MCDYSLEKVDNRKAVKGEVLTLKTFLGHTKGFIDPKNPDCAVCLEPGTRLQVTVQKIVESGVFWKRRRVFAEQTISAMFVQPVRVQQTRRDSLLFTSDGSDVDIRKDSTWLLQDLPVGTTARVISIQDENNATDYVDFSRTGRADKICDRRTVKKSAADIFCRGLTF